MTQQVVVPPQVAVVEDRRLATNDQRRPIETPPHVGPVAAVVGDEEMIDVDTDPDRNYIPPHSIAVSWRRGYGSRNGNDRRHQRVIFRVHE